MMPMQQRDAAERTKFCAVCGSVLYEYDYKPMAWRRVKYCPSCRTLAHQWQAANCNARRRKAARELQALKERHTSSLEAENARWREIVAEDERRIRQLEYALSMRKT